MDENIDKAIEMLVAEVSRPGSRPKPQDALWLTQAALNLAHAKKLIDEIGQQRPRKTG